MTAATTPATVAVGAAFDDWMRAAQARFEALADAALPPAGRAPGRMHEAMRYATLGGGKRVRALLAWAAAEAAGGAIESADPVALALEFVHAYSLVHDDLPCMDNDVLRRGKPTVHVAFDEATAMLAGDALQAEAFRMLAEAPLPAEARIGLVGDLARAIGPAGMCGGQAIDLAAVGVMLGAEQLETMHRMKTGALLAASVTMGGRAGGADAAELPRLARYGEAIGLAFQVVDDILDVEASSATLGKTAGKDAAANKPTYVSALGLEGARAQAARLRAEALEALGVAPRTKRLRELADFIVLRAR